jgi:hypothetical protein
MLYAISDGSDFLPHKNEVTDSKAEKSDGHERNQMRGDDVQALQKGKRTLESSQGKSLHGSHQDQGSRGLSHRIENG